MIHKLWARITLSFLVLISILLVLSGFFLSRMMKDTYYDLKESHLLQTAKLVLNVIEREDLLISPTDLQEEMNLLAESIQSRLTILDQKGNVLADSEDSPTEMENHANRPEVKKVLQGQASSGISIRYSKTLGFHMMYVTVPIMEKDQPQGVIRVAYSLQKIDLALRKLWLSISISLLSVFLLTGLIGMRLAKSISKPIEEMIGVSERLKEKDFSARVNLQPKGELGQLATAINMLASSLKTQMETIQENEQQLSGVLTNMTSGVLLVDMQGRILLANKAMAQFMGEEPQAFIGKMYMDVSQNLEFNSLMKECLKTGKEIREEITFYYPKERIMDVHLAPYVREKHELKGMIAVLHDVTEVHRLENMRRDFVANVSHELKTPVTSVKGFAETLLDGAMYDEELCREFLSIIYRESERLHRLISELLYLSRIEQHHIPLKLEQMNITEAVWHVANTIQKEADKKKLTLMLPEQGEIWIEGEKDRIQQIVLNLLSNAIAYTPEGGKIVVTLWEEANQIKLSIADTGIGIPSSELPRIFERFYRVEKARSRRSGGTGLGLAIVKHLIESHHGKIEVKSEEAKGTTFTVTLPKYQEKN
ncbi:cell wall metabolism sensor histidine kinase WalK [Lederbergia sp. NSJ-179]|uniref:two-component system histidine kinase PnpS n=1 Tax=Lederbergia sp. NSJ-179 TaxID=2931402 RepID=UPI001FD0D8EE|nr:ATP-binding protein [Lederbergia sp. NSJ-179]MCJ7840200.1 cell wall metabolism sensor histidine kinase WalK [Lederbergia sp. NSJ-179]